MPAEHTTTTRPAAPATLPRSQKFPLMPPLNAPLAIPLPARPLVGTPFDPSPRFEYPFPTPHAERDYHPASALVLPVSAYPHAHFVVRAAPTSAPAPAPAPASPPNRPSSAAKRPILGQPATPPVPPSLAKRRDTTSKGR
ncbi:hypothetical protein K488DRAFT_70145 [Vararia minispora EC-137]|uniref:Uncharacterized protein n=1 Tax=Vararia minispora EC-137 TaxID=1314806 RepID=A0ACB8QNW7_9AGAM|nr:hypothetical protein K488DRAFT_70145 [Vararia minispora EC-137]